MKLISLGKLKKIVNDLKKEKKKIVWTNGCFDILHAGHVHSLREAKKCGDLLIVGLNSDVSVKKIKGESRPIMNENERVEILSAIEYIDHIILFDEETPLNIIKELRPNIIVKGEDYKNKEVVGSEIAKVVLVSLKNCSTTDIIERIKKK